MATVRCKVALALSIGPMCLTTTPFGVYWNPESQVIFMVFLWFSSYSMISLAIFWAIPNSFDRHGDRMKQVISPGDLCPSCGLLDCIPCIPISWVLLGAVTCGDLMPWCCDAHIRRNGELNGSWRGSRKRSILWMTHWTASDRTGLGWFKGFLWIFHGTNGIIVGE